MARKEANTQPPGGYLDSTHAPLNCLVFLLPILAAYEVGAWFYPDSNLAPRHFAGFLEQFGLVGHFLPPVALVLAILIWQAGTDRPWKIELTAVGGMLAESILWMFPIEGFSILGAKLLAAGALAAPTPSPNTPVTVLSGAGAAVYEEFLFRLLAMGLIYGVGHKLIKAPKAPVVVMSIAVSAVMFAAYHFVGRPINWGMFGFLCVVGVYLGVLYVGRGLGIAIGAHACYNIIFSLRQPM